MKHKLIWTIVIALVLGALLTAPSFAAEIIDSGSAGSSATWTLDDEGTLVISGSGSITQKFTNAAIKKIVIEDGVSSISAGAFESCSGLTSILIPPSVKSIEGHAFMDCTSLTSVTLPSSVTSIANFTFNGCTRLTSVTIPSSVTSIGNYAFGGCHSLASVSLPSSVTSIGECAFYNCIGLTSMSIPSGVTRIAEHTFFGCASLASVTIPSSVTIIKANAFENCTSLTSMTIPSSVTSIEDYAFMGCTNLMSVTIPSSITRIANYTFHGCSRLANITIPSSVTSIGALAFCQCTGLTSVNIPSSVTSIGINAFNDCTSLRSVTIPVGVSTISDGAFSGCSSLSTVDFSTNFSGFGSGCFSGCTSLSHGYFEGTREQWLTKNFSGGTMFQLRPVYAADGKTIIDYVSDVPMSFEAVSYDYSLTIQSAEDVQSNEYCIHVVDQNSTPLSGASIEVDYIVSATQTKTTNAKGNAVFDRFTYGNPTITVSKEGYITWTNANSVWSKSSDGFETVILYPVDYEAVKLRGVYYHTNPVDENNYKSAGGYTDLLMKTKTLGLPCVADGCFRLDSGNFALVCEAISANDVQLYALYQNDTWITSSTTGIFNVNVSQFQKGGGCYVKTYGKNGEQCNTAINLKFNQIELDKDGWGFSFGEGKPNVITVTIPDEVPIIGGDKYDFDLGRFGKDSIVQFALTNEKIRVGINMEMLRAEGTDDSTDQSFKKRFDALKKMGLKEYLDTTIYDELVKKDSSESKVKLFGKDVDFTLIGYGECSWESSEVKVDLIVKAESELLGKETNNLFLLPIPVPPMILPIPYTGQATIKIAANATSEIDYKWKESTLNGSLDLELDPKLDLYGGLGVSKIFSGGVYGAADFAVKLRLLGTPFGLQSIALNADIGVRGYLFALSTQKTLCMNTWYLYTRNDMKSVSPKTLLAANNISLYDSNEYEKADLSYLSEESDWLGEKEKPKLFAAMKSPSIHEVTELTPLLANTYRNAQPTMISDGEKLYAAFLKANSENGCVIPVVTCFDGQSWKSPISVSDDIFYGHTPTLYCDNNGEIWLAYAETSNHAAETLGDYAASQTIVVGTIDKATLAFTKNAEFTGNGFVHSPVFCDNNGMTTLLWIDQYFDPNDLNTIFYSASTSIVSSFYDEGWQEDTTFITLDRHILTYDAGVIEGKLSVACITDEDGDGMTNDDRRICVIENGSIETVYNECASSIEYSVLPGDNEPGFVWVNDGMLSSTTGSTVDIDEITPNFDICDDSIYYVVKTGDNSSNLMKKAYENGSWKNSVEVTYCDAQYLEDISAATLEGADYILGMHATVEIQENAIDDSKDLVWAKVGTRIPNLVLETAQYDWEELEPGEEYEIQVHVLNSGDHTVNEIEVYADGEYVHTEECELEPGETAEFSINMVCPDGYTEYTLEVEEPGEADYTPDDNSAVLCVGYGDLEVSAEYQQIGRGNSIVAYIENTGIEPLEGTLTLYDENDRIVKRQILDELSPGEGSVVECDLNTADIPLEGTVYRIAVESEKEELTKYNNEVEVSVFRKSYTVSAESVENRILFTVDEMVVKAYDTAAFTAEVLEEGTAFAVQDEEGNEIPYSAVEEGRYTFTMPESYVIIKEAVSEGPEESGLLCSGYCGGDEGAEYDEESEAHKNLTWKLHEDGRLVIFGEGGMMDDWGMNSAINRFNNEIKSIEIGTGVTSIGDSAFEHFSSLTSITIPSSVTSIGEGAFGDCNGLVNITVDESSSAFSSKDGILFNKEQTLLVQYPIGDSRTEYVIPDGVTGIGDHAFDGCYNLTSITIPDGVTSIDAQAFVCCENLKSAYFQGDAPATFSFAVFDSTSPGFTIYYVEGKSGWTTPQWNGYNTVAIAAPEEPEEPSIIASGHCGCDVNAEYDEGSGAYKNLTWTLYEDGRLIISGEGEMKDYSGDISVFTQYRDQITSLEIGVGVTSIGSDAFGHCISMTSVTIPDSVTDIGAYAFGVCSGLASVTIPDSVTYIGIGAFGCCYGLTSITVDENNPVYYDIDGVLFDKKQAMLVQYPAGNPRTEYIIPEGVSGIGDCAFEACSKLMIVTIPDSVTVIGVRAFLSCRGLETIIFDGTDSQWQQVFLGDNWCEEGVTVIFTGTCYTLFYDANGGTNAPDPQTAPSRSEIWISEMIPARGGYTFLGWGENADDEEPLIPAGTQCYVTIGQDTTLYAIWQRDAVRVTGVSLDQTSLTMNVGDSPVSLSAAVCPEDADDQSVSWSSDHTEVAAVTSSGQVTAISEGVAVITVTTSDGGFTAECTVTVLDDPAVGDMPTVTVGRARGTAGGTVKVPVILSNNPGIIDMTLKITYDSSVLTLIGVNDSALLSGEMHSNRYSSPYSLVWENDTASENFMVNGTVAELVFEVADGADEGDYAIGITVPRDGVMNYDGDAVNFRLVGGVCTVIDYILGDVNDDGDVTPRDRLILARYLADWEGYELSDMVFDAADINGDGELTNRDRLILARHLADWEGYGDLSLFWE